MEIPSDEPYYSGPLVVTCTACIHQREHPPFETHIVLGGQTSLHCPKCKEVLPHFVGTPSRKSENLEDFGRKRKSRS